MEPRRYLTLVGASALLLLQACSGGASDTGTGGTGGTAGSTGSAGATGAGGATGGAGSAGTGGATTATGGRTGTGGTATGTGGSGGSAGTGGAAGATATILDQTGNPLTKIVTVYTSWLSTAADDAAKLAADRTLADNMITWQLPHGGFYKNAKTVYAAPWNGTDPRSGWLGANNVELGTIDNGGT